MPNYLDYLYRFEVKYLGTVRVEIGKFNIEGDIDALLEAIKKISEE